MSTPEPDDASAEYQAPCPDRLRRKPHASPDPAPPGPGLRGFGNIADLAIGDRAYVHWFPALYVDGHGNLWLSGKATAVREQMDNRAVLIERTEAGARVVAWVDKPHQTVNDQLNPYEGDVWVVEFPDQPVDVLP